MQVLHARTTGRPSSRISLVTGLIIGLLLVVASAALAYLAFATPFPDRFIPPARSSTVTTIAGALGWTLVLVAPAIAGLAGLTRLAGVVEQASTWRRSHPIVALRRVLGEDYAAFTGMRLPDGRLVPEAIVGPHGIAIFEPIPPTDRLRDLGGRWEMRVAKNRWVPVDSPTDRAVRNAERVRRWLSYEEHDFVVHVNVAVIVPGPGYKLERTPACAVITRDQVPAYLNALPVQRGLTAERRVQLHERIRQTL